METYIRFADSKLIKACKQGNLHAKQLKRHWHRRKHMEICNVISKRQRSHRRGDHVSRKRSRIRTPKTKSRYLAKNGVRNRSLSQSYFSGSLEMKKEKSKTESALFQGEEHQPLEHRRISGASNDGSSNDNGPLARTEKRRQEGEGEG